jgi:hypothetical protein
LFRSIDERFCYRLTPINTCAEDVEEEGFQPVRFGHVDVCMIPGRGRLDVMGTIESSQSTIIRECKCMYCGVIDFNDLVRPIVS